MVWHIRTTYWAFFLLRAYGMNREFVATLDLIMAFRKLCRVIEGTKEREAKWKRVVKRWKDENK